MKNSEMMTLNLKRINVCDVRMAINSVIINMRSELRDEETTETRKEILGRSIKKWEALKAEIVKQFDAQDAN